MTKYFAFFVAMIFLGCDSRKDQNESSQIDLVLKMEKIGPEIEYSALKPIFEKPLFKFDYSFNSNKLKKDITFELVKTTHLDFINKFSGGANGTYGVSVLNDHFEALFFIGETSFRLMELKIKKENENFKLNSNIQINSLKNDVMKEFGKFSLQYNDWLGYVSYNDSGIHIEKYLLFRFDNDHVKEIRLVNRFPY